MDAGSGLCRGCYRSLDEIIDWSRVDDAARRDILARVAERRQKAVPEKPTRRHAEEAND